MTDTLRDFRRTWPQLVITEISWLGGPTVSHTGSNLAVLVVGLGAVIIISGLAILAVSIFTTVMFPLLVVRLYRSSAGPGELRPEIASIGSLGQRAALRVPGKIIIAVGMAAGGTSHHLDRRRNLVATGDGSNLLRGRRLET